jgi:thioredoxin-related protein
MAKGYTFLSVLLFVCLLSLPVMGRYANKNAGVQWMTPAETDAAMNKETKAIIIDVYTTWCHYCKVMDATTWKNDSVTQYVQDHFYAMKLNAEDKQPLTWNGKVYEYLPRYKVNKLAVELLRGNMVYPSTIIIPEKGDWEIIPGAFKPADVEIVLKYYGSGANEKMDFATWQKQFHGLWR